MRGPWIAVWSAAFACLLIGVLIVPDWHLPVGGRQLAWRSGSAVQFQPTPAEAASLIVAPRPLPAWPESASAGGFKNLQVLNGRSPGEVLRLMASMTAWVAPKEGCGFCHAAPDYASDANPRKLVARQMILMTRMINADYGSHVGRAGVTCFTCHQTQPVPEDVWYAARPQPNRPMIDKSEDWHEDEKTVRKFFPDEGYEEYLLESTPGASQSYTALPTGSVASQRVVKRLYEVMMQMSDGIGVNCGYCHNSRAFWDWGQSTPARWTGYYGIQMTREINRRYLLPAGLLLPQTREPLYKVGELNVPPNEAGATAGNGLANCATCHHAQPRPVGAGLASAYPALLGPDPAAAQPAPGGGAAPARGVGR